MERSLEQRASRAPPFCQRHEAVLAVENARFFRSRHVHDPNLAARKIRNGALNQIAAGLILRDVIPALGKGLCGIPFLRRPQAAEKHGAFSCG